MGATQIATNVPVNATPKPFYGKIFFISVVPAQSWAGTINARRWLRSLIARSSSSSLQVLPSSCSDVNSVKLDNVFKVSKRFELFFVPKPRFGSQVVRERGGFAVVVAQGHISKPLSQYRKIEKRG
jgi:hypothetical protein